MTICRFAVSRGDWRARRIAGLLFTNADAFGEHADGRRFGEAARTLPAAPSLPETDPEAQAQDDLDKKAAKAAIEADGYKRVNVLGKGADDSCGQRSTEGQLKFSLRWIARAECLWTDIEKVRLVQIYGDPKEG